MTATRAGYSFEKPKTFKQYILVVANFFASIKEFFAPKTYQLEKDLEALANNLGVKLKLLKPSEQLLLKRFCNVNLGNIIYYSKKIRTESIYRKVYAFLSIILLAGIPLFIFYYTNSMSVNIGDVELINKERNLDSLYSVGGLILALITAILGLHKFLSEIMAKRIFRAHFFQAKMDLMKIVFELEEDHKVSGENGSTNLNLKLIEDLEKGIKTSREIVDNETLNYFKLSTPTTIDLGSILSNSMNTAKSLVSGLQSRNYTDKVAELEKAKKEQEKSEDETRTKEAKLKSQVRKLRILVERQNAIEDKIEDLEEEEGDNTQRIGKLEERLDDLDDKQLLVEGEIEVLTEQLDSTNGRNY